MPVCFGAPFEVPHVLLTSVNSKKFIVICHYGVVLLFLLRLGCKLMIQSSGTTAPLCIRVLHAKAGWSACRCSSLHVNSLPPSSPILSSLHKGIRHFLHHHCVVCLICCPSSFLYLLQIKQVRVYAFPTVLPALSCVADGGLLTRPLSSAH